MFETAKFRLNRLGIESECVRAATSLSQFIYYCAVHLCDNAGRNKIGSIDAFSSCLLSAFDEKTKKSATIGRDSPNFKVPTRGRRNMNEV